MQRNHYIAPRQHEAARLAAIAAILDAIHRDDQRALCFGRPRRAESC